MVRYWLKSILSGLLIALGCAVNIKIGGIYGAVLFATGLVTIITFHLPLFTGIVAEKPSWRMILVLVGNVLGAAVGHFLWLAEIEPVETSLVELFCGACGTGVLMVAAYRSQSKLIAVFGVALFILCGFPHCIAEVGYFRMTWQQWLVALAGNIVGGQVWRILKNDEGI